MSLEKTRERLVRLLAQEDCAVIALSGKWGTGKTHLWNEVKKASAIEKVRAALYVSLFGLSSMDQVKRKLMESAMPIVISHGGLVEAAKNVFSAGVTAASQHYKALAAIKDLNLLLMSPAVLKDKLIVIDDIERKHAKLGIDEVLGFIDDYSQQFGVRFVVVLNDDQLSTDGDQAKLWATVREKVIDEEVKLSTTPGEAFEIAIQLTPSKYKTALQQAITACRLTNIRIIRKIIKKANQILEGQDLDAAVLARTVPSIVLFTAIHYRGIQDGPDLQFALNVAESIWSQPAQDGNSERTDLDKRKDQWRMLIRNIGVHCVEEFENVLVEFLDSGLFESDQVRTIITRFVENAQALQASNDVHTFIEDSIWDHRKAYPAVLEEARGFLSRVHLLEPHVVTRLSNRLAEIPDGQVLAQEVVNVWVDAFGTESRHDIDHIDPDDSYGRPLHPNVAAAVRAARQRGQSNTTMVLASISIVENQGWGPLEEISMRQASPADFEAAIRDLDLPTLRQFMRAMMEMRLNRAAYDAHFGRATQHFVDACRAITNDASSPRLAELIVLLFSKRSLAAELIAPTTPPIERVVDEA